MVFKDQIVRCAACGTEFVYTVREQRQRAERGLSLDPPTFCPDCRGADARLAEAEQVRPAAATASLGAPATAPRGQRSSGPEGRYRTGARPGGRSGGGRPGGGRPERGARSCGGRGDKPGGRAPRRGPRQTELRFRFVGIVKWFDEQKGYGFIAQDESGDELFVHSSGILVEGERLLAEGQPVEFEVEHTPRGLQAVDVIPLD